jgi:hypothetical protein
MNEVIENFNLKPNFFNDFDKKNEISKEIKNGKNVLMILIMNRK